MQNNKTNLLFVDHYSSVGGGQKVLLDLVANLDPERFNSIVAYNGEKEGFHQALQGTPVKLVAAPLSRNSQKQLRETGLYKNPLGLLKNLPLITNATLTLKQIIDDFSIDLIHTNSRKAGLLALPPAKLSGTPLVAHAHVPRSYSYHGWLDNLLFGGADKIVANSNYTAETFGPWKDKITTIYNGIDTALFDPEQSERTRVRNEFKLDQGMLLVGMVARVTPRKRCQDFIRAAKILLERGYPLKFIIVGGSFPDFGSKYEKKVSKLVDQLGLRERVVFTGHRDDIVDVMDALDIMVLPAEEEAFGLVLVEAMLMETAVVAADDAGIPEVIDDGETGVLFEVKDVDDLANQIQLLVENVDLREKLGKTGRYRSLRKFNLRTTAEKFEDLYTQVIAEKN